MHHIWSFFAKNAQYVFVRIIKNSLKICLIDINFLRKNVIDITSLRYPRLLAKRWRRVQIGAHLLNLNDFCYAKTFSWKSCFKELKNKIKIKGKSDGKKTYTAQIYRKEVQVL